MYGQPSTPTRKFRSIYLYALKRNFLRLPHSDATITVRRVRGLISMTIAEILDQAKELSPQERKELAKLLIDTLDMPSEQKSTKSQEHWGKQE